MKKQPRRKSQMALDKEFKKLQTEVAIEKLSRIKAAYSGNQSAGYVAGNTGKREFRNWSPSGFTGDAVYLSDLSLIRQRAADLFRNSSIAAGAIKTASNNVIGSGLTLQCAIDREYLAQTIGWTDEDCENWEYTVERKWRNFWHSPEVDAGRRMTGPELEYLAYQTYKAEGECFALLPRFSRPGSKYDLRIQLFGAHRVSNPLGQFSDRKMRDGVEINERGEPVAYHFQKEETLYEFNVKWEKVPAYGAQSGRRNVLHVYRPDSIGQTRGIPWITTIIPELHEIKKYEDHERIRAAVSTLFAGFIKSNRSDALDDPFSDDPNITDGSRGIDREKDYTLSPGVIHQLDLDEDMVFANPASPNSQFGEFIKANLRQIGMYLQIPYEMLVKEFNSSYTASKASRIEAWRFFITERGFFTRNFNQPIYNEWLAEQVALGEIDAPGFLEDEDLKSAFCATLWIGETQGQIDPTKETQAAVMRIQNGLTTTAYEAAAIGQDFEKNIKKIPRERQLIREAGLPIETTQSVEEEVAEAEAPEEEAEGEEPAEQETKAEQQARLKVLK